MTSPDSEIKTPFNYQQFLKNLTQHPGVYRMLDAQNKALYVGKARNLKQRISQYFHSGLSPKLQRMVAQIATIEVTITNTETEALLLENNLIKTLQPRYNVLLRDDKSYPYIYLTTQDKFPRLAMTRRHTTKQGRYFGPYPSAKAVRATLNSLQRIFPIRQCEDAWYRSRSRPCLQYQLKRCSAPCVGLVTPEIYAQEVNNTILFLEGKATQIIDTLVQRMETAAGQLAFEEAARLRDQIATLNRIQERQSIDSESGDLDIVALAIQDHKACIQVFSVRNGRILGNQAFFPKIPAQTKLDETPENIMAAFLAQHYLGRPIPTELLVTHYPTDGAVLETGFSTQSGRKIAIRDQVRGDRARWLQLAISNAQLALLSKTTGYTDIAKQLIALQDALKLATVPQRLECFDISHTSGESPVASCVVFDSTGPKYSDYRRFNINSITYGDDYAALRQALTRRYKRIANQEFPIPDILFIDGGRGQLTQAVEVLAELNIEVSTIIGIAKGPGRKPGLEQLWLKDQEQSIILPEHSSALHLIQQIRDEAHRFAITGHRRHRAKARRTSLVEEIPGIGPKRRQRLLNQFGGFKNLTRAGEADIAKVAGIGPNLAKYIYAKLHPMPAD